MRELDGVEQPKNSQVQEGAGEMPKERSPTVSQGRSPAQSTDAWDVENRRQSYEATDKAVATLGEAMRRLQVFLSSYSHSSPDANRSSHTAVSDTNFPVA
eukprot:2533003-Rhodomonas_salina.3